LSSPATEAARGKIDPRTTIGIVHLRVRDLDRVVAFYEESLGLVAKRRDRGSALLGSAEHDLVALEAKPDARPAHGSTGLYHFAILVPSRADLGASLRRLIASREKLHGASDHGVSEALYLSDPEGNGIEIYRDRPKAEWPRVGGDIAMTSDPVDLGSLGAEAGASAQPRVAAGTVIGHVHLKVSDVADAERFYLEVLGFERVARYDSASFLSAGGYHHHIGINSWESRGAAPAPPGSAGLRHFEIRLPDEPARAAVLARARAAGCEIENEGGSALLSDPSANRVALVVAPNR
jgi:catechol 2,3-dioxygenase